MLYYTILYYRAYCSRTCLTRRCIVYYSILLYTVTAYRLPNQLQIGLSLFNDAFVEDNRRHQFQTLDDISLNTQSPTKAVIIKPETW